MVEDAIDGQWVAPPLLASTPLVIMKFRISRSGVISRIHIAESSGHTHYDSAAQRAVQAVNPLPPFPSDISESFFDVQYRFIKD
jgi:TonB family protein